MTSNTMLVFFFTNMSLYFNFILYTVQILPILYLLKIKLKYNENQSNK